MRRTVPYAGGTAAGARTPGGRSSPLCPPSPCCWPGRFEKENTIEATEQSAHLSSRRSFLLKGAAVGAATMGGGRLLADPPAASASGGLTPGDAAILRFLAALETLET